MMTVTPEAGVIAYSQRWSQPGYVYTIQIYKHLCSMSTVTSNWKLASNGILDPQQKAMYCAKLLCLIACTLSPYRRRTVSGPIWSPFSIGAEEQHFALYRPRCLVRIFDCVSLHDSVVVKLYAVVVSLCVLCWGAVSQVGSASSSSSSSSHCDEYAVIIDDADSSNMSLCGTRRRHLPVYRSRGQQVRVYVTNHRSFLLIYHGTAAHIHDAPENRSTS